MHYYTRHLGDYAKDTGHLSLLEHGVYTVLLDWSYATERTLPEEKEAIYRICRVQNPAEKKAVDKVVAEFFPKRQDGCFNKRVSAEIALFQRKSESAKKANEVRWHSARTPNGVQPDSDGSPTRARVPITNNQYPISNNHCVGESESVPQPPAGTHTGSEIPSEEVIHQFAAAYPGNLALGAPAGIPRDWTDSWIEFALSRQEWPNHWQQVLVKRFERNFKDRHPKAIGHLPPTSPDTGRPNHGSEKNAAPMSAAQSRYVWSREVEEIRARMWENDELNKPQDPSDLPRLRELEKKLAAL